MTVITGAIADSGIVPRALEGSGAVVAALGPRSNDRAAELALERGRRNLVAAMADAGVSRLVALSGAGATSQGIRSPSSTGWYRASLPRLGARPVAIDQARIERQIRELALDHAAGRLEDEA